MDCNGNKEGNGDSNKVGRRVMVVATVTKRAMLMAMRVSGNKEGNCKGGKSNGDSNKGGRQEN